MPVGVMPCLVLYASWIARRRSVSSIVRCMLTVTRSAYMMTWPPSCRAARPTVCMRACALLRKPSLSASSIATSDTSGKSSPSRSRLMPTSTSYMPSLRSRKMSVRSSVSTSLCRYATLMLSSFKYSVKSSLMRFVSVVTSTRSPLATVSRISAIRSSICPSIGRTSIGGSRSPVGRITCSTGVGLRLSSYSAGVALT